MKPPDGVRALVDRYFSAIDRRDWESLASCFAEAAVFEGGWDPARDRAADVRHGRGDVVAFVRQVEVFPSSLHAVASLHVEPADAGLGSVTFATAYLVDPRGGATIVRMRGLRYTDRLVEGSDGWTIAHRRHEPLWEVDAPAVPLVAVPANA